MALRDTNFTVSEFLAAAILFALQALILWGAYRLAIVPLFGAPVLSYRQMLLLSLAFRVIVYWVRGSWS